MWKFSEKPRENWIWNCLVLNSLLETLVKKQYEKILIAYVHTHWNWPFLTLLTVCYRINIETMTLIICYQEDAINYQNTDNNTVTDDTVTDETVHTADSSKFSTESQRLRKSSSSSNLRQLEHEASRAYLLDDSRRPRQRGLSHKERPVTSGGSVRHRTEGLSNRYDATATKKKSRRSQSARAPRLAASASPRPPHLRQGRVPSRRGIGGNEPSPPRMEL